MERALLEEGLPAEDRQLDAGLGRMNAKSSGGVVRRKASLDRRRENSGEGGEAVVQQFFGGIAVERISELGQQLEADRGSWGSIFKDGR